MESTAHLRYIRIAPRKMRLVANLIRGKKLARSRMILKFTPNKSTESLLKLIESAVASAQHNFGVEETQLYISKIIVNEGPKLKRIRPRARGKAFPIQKKTSHISVVLAEITLPSGADKEQRKKTEEASTIANAGAEGQESTAKKVKKIRGSGAKNVMNHGYREQAEKSKQVAKKIFRRKTG